MDAILWAVIVLAIAALAFLVRRDRTRGIDALGKKYNVLRWEGEDNEHLLERIRDRICITGGRRW